jgi:hypothetical protein
MSDARATNSREPTTYDKIYFWLGLGRLPRAFNAWAQEQIRSRWFPLRRMAPGIVWVPMWLVFSIDTGRSFIHYLGLAILSVL